VDKKMIDQLNDEFDATVKREIWKHLGKQLTKPVEEMPICKHLRTRILSGLKRNKMDKMGTYHTELTIGEALTISLSELKRTPNFGRKSFKYWKELRSNYLEGFRRSLD